MAASTPENPPPRVTTRSLQKIRRDGGNISMLTAYDYPTAEVLDEAGIDLLLVGDSLAMVVQGHDTTLPVTMDDMIYHAKMVGRAAKWAMVVVDFAVRHGFVDFDEPDYMEIVHLLRTGGSFATTAVAAVAAP